MLQRTRVVTILVLIAALLSLSAPQMKADTFRPVVRGKRGVVAGGHPLSVEAGLRILQNGGNAVDAGVATTLAASVIEFSHFSFGGEVPILIKLKGQKVAVIEGMGQAPLKATREFFVNRAANESIKGGLIPATLVALQTALRVLLGTPMERKYKLSRGGGLRVFPMRGFLGIGVGLACAMAHLAAGDRIGVRGGQRRVLGLPILLKLSFVA